MHLSRCRVPATWVIHSLRPGDGKRSKDVSFVMGASKATALRFRSQAPILCYAYTGALPHVMAEPIESPASARSSEEQQLIQQLSSYCRQLHWGATGLQLLTVITALAAIILSLVVATYTGSKEFESNGRVLKLLAFLSAIFTAMFSSFRLRTKAADLRMAFRMLNTDLMRYRIGELNASQLITSYSKAEERVGHVEVDGLPERSPAKPPEV